MSLDRDVEILDGLIWKPRLRRAAQIVTFLLAFTIVALFTRGVVTNIEYKFVPAISVVQIPGQTLSDRIVVVDLGDRPRTFRTSERLLVVTAGEPVCVAKRTIFGGRWRSYQLSLPRYCRDLFRNGFMGSMFRF